MDDVYYRAADVEQTGDREFKFVASDESTDGHGDIVRAAGWDLRRYKKNPIVLFGHNSDVPIGYSPKTAIEGTRMISDIKLADEGTSEFIDTLVKLMKQKIVRSVSVGFKTTKPPNFIRDAENDRIIGFEFVGQELLEISVVSVPSNPNALSLAKSWGVRDSTLTRMFCEDALVQRAALQRRLRILKLGASS